MSLKKAEALIVVTVLIILFLSFFKPSMTGFVPAKTERQNLNLMLDSSQTYTLQLNASMPIVSIGVSGMVVGNGTVYIWLGNEGERLLVWSNALPTKPVSENIITGMVTAVITPGDIDDQTDHTLVFINECIETCILPERFQQKEKYELIFEIEPGTVLKIDEIIYLMLG